MASVVDYCLISILFKIGFSSYLAELEIQFRFIISFPQIVYKYLICNITSSARGDMWGHEHCRIRERGVYVIWADTMDIKQPWGHCPSVPTLPRSLITGYVFIISYEN